MRKEPKYPNAIKIKIPSNLESGPKKFEIDCLVDNLVHEIKWRDTTTDGKKERVSYLTQKPIELLKHIVRIYIKNPFISLIRTIVSKYCQ